MLQFARPANSDRMHAMLHSLIMMRYDGGVRIDGAWDPDPALRYLERRLKMPCIPTLVADGSLFRVRDKRIRFDKNAVYVFTD